ncbi:hypothetical protein L9G15_01040 [Shewanella sp. A3A]|nr:hypothetical protein [Shewanella ferrihydritica]
MFNRHSILHTSNNSINYLIVDVNHRLGMIAFYDLNAQPQQRRRVSTVEAKPSTRPARVQSKPRSMPIDEFSELVRHYDYEVELADYNNGLYIPKQKTKLERERLIAERNDAADDNYALIADIVEDDEMCAEYLYTNRGNQHIQHVAQKNGVKGAHIARLLAQYFSRGCSRAAMYPNYRYCGCNYQPCLAVDESSPKRGRPAKHTKYRNRLRKDEENIEAFLRQLGRRNYKRLHLTKAYQIYDFYYQSQDVAVEHEGQKSVRRIPLPEHESISYSQFYYYIKFLEKSQSFAWTKNGKKNFLKDYESRFGRAREDIPGPSFRMEIDATIEDLYLQFPYYLKQRLSSGRPTVYRVACTYSGMVTGIHVGFGGPNWTGVMQALFNAFTSKVDFCKRYGIDIEEKDWPCSVLCNELTIDNGVEYPSKNMMQFLDETIGIDCINYTAVYSGQSKGTVEGGFSIDKDESVKTLAGYLERQPERGAAHASNFAKYTYDEYMQILIYQTIIRNNEVFKNNIHDQVMSEQGVQSTSLAVWNFGLEHYMNGGRNKRMKPEQLMFALLPAGNASTTAKGIRFQKLYYSCQHAHSMGWLTDSKTRQVKKLEVRYLERDTNKIWYRYDGKVYTAELNDHSEIYRNRCWLDALNRLELYSEERAEQARLEREKRIQQSQFTSELTQAAKERMRGTAAPTSKSPQKHINLLREIETELKKNKAASLISEIFQHDESGDVRVKEDANITSSINKRNSTKNKQLKKLYGGGSS